MPGPFLQPDFVALVSLKFVTPVLKPPIAEPVPSLFYPIPHYTAESCNSVYTVVNSVFDTKGPAFPCDTHKLTLIHNYHSNCYSQRIRNFSFHPKINLTSIFVCHLSRSSYAPFTSNHGTQFLYPNNSCLSNASIMLSDAHTYPTRQNRVLPPSHYLLTFFLGFLSSDFLVLSFPLLLPSTCHPPRPSSTDLQSVHPGRPVRASNANCSTILGTLPLSISVESLLGFSPVETLSSHVLHIPHTVSAVFLILKSEVASLRLCLLLSFPL